MNSLKNIIVFMISNLVFTVNITVHALISITKSIRSALGESKYVRDIFVDLHNAFDTVNHKYEQYEQVV